MYTAQNLPAYHGRTPPAAELVTSAPLDTAGAMRLLADLDNIYPPRLRPRDAALMTDDGRIIVYLWPHVWPDTALTLLLTEYGGARRPAETPGGQCWLLDDELPRMLAARLAREVGV